MIYVLLILLRVTDCVLTRYMSSVIKKGRKPGYVAVQSSIYGYIKSRRI